MRHAPKVHHTNVIIQFINSAHFKEGICDGLRLFVVAKRPFLNDGFAQWTLALVLAYGAEDAVAERGEGRGRQPEYTYKPPTGKRNVGMVSSADSRGLRGCMCEFTPNVHIGHT